MESAGQQCHELYGRLEDTGSRPTSPTQRRLICNSQHRVQPLLVSRGHIVRLWIDHDGLHRFLIHYAGISLSSRYFMSIIYI